MEIVRKPLRLRSLVDEMKRQGRPVGFVPTMGALHVGHLSLVRLARQRGADVVVSIFVNPKQFGPSEDFAAYPRDLTGDCELLSKEGVAVVYAPDGEEIYPPGFRTHVEVEGMSDVLSGATRPGHFRGVTTVVLKLLNQVQPDFAVFGLKDAQQVVIIQRLVRDLDVPVEIVAAPTVREPDGLACSSRNAYLDEPARRSAPVIYRALQEAIRRVHEGERAPSKVEEAVTRVLQSEERIAAIDYVKVVNAHDLSEMRKLNGLVLVLVSVKVRIEGRPPATLIDNVRIEVNGES